jgi:hypothetical protein
VLSTSRTPYYSQAAAIGAEYFEDADDFCEEHPDVVILASSILSTEPVVRNLPLTRLKRSTLIVDVLSVKVSSFGLLLLAATAGAAVVCSLLAACKENGFYAPDDSITYLKQCLTRMAQTSWHSNQLSMRLKAQHTHCGCAVSQGGMPR